MKSVNLMYHDIVSQKDIKSGFQNKSSVMYNTDSSLLEQQILAIKNQGGGIENVVYTFDDGGVSLFNLGVPVLDRYGIKGVFFIPTAFIGKCGFMSKEQIVELHKSGHIIGSHSHTHPSNIASLKYDDIVLEWKTSLDILSEILGETIDTASIPNGYCSSKVLRAAKEAGISTLYTSEPTDSVKINNGITIIGRYVMLNYTTAENAVRIVKNKGYRFFRHILWITIETVKLILGPYYDTFKKVFIR